MNSQRETAATARSGPFALDDGRLPIVLGVTGHRTLADADRLHAELEARIRALVAAHPHSPFVALSPLAEGADRLFAHAALAVGIPLYVVLPMAAADYEQDFPETVAEFRELCSRAECVFVAQIQSSHAALLQSGNVDATAGTSPEQQRRNIAYARVGLYMAQRTHVLFALWDGKPVRGLGGTAQIIEYKRSGHLGTFQLSDAVGSLGIDSRAYHLLDEPEPGLIVHIPVRRSDTEQPASAHTTQTSIGKWDTDLMFSRLDDFNRAILELQRSADERSAEAATSNPVAEPTPQLADDTAAAQREYQRLRVRARQADRIASRHMTHLRAWFARLFIFAGIAVTAEVMFEDHARPTQFEGSVAFVVYLLTMAAILWMVLRIKQQRRNLLANEYRAVAEGLRIQCAWFRAGVPDLVARHYLRRHSDALGWLSFALRGAISSQREHTISSDISFVEKYWIRDQQRYLSNALQKRHRTVSGLRRSAYLLFAAGMAASVVTLLGLLPYVAWGLMNFLAAPIVLDVTIPLQAILLATSGLLTTYNEFAAYEDDIREFEHSLSNYNICAQRLAALDLPRQQALLHEIGIEAVRENAEWVIVHEAHDAKIPL